MSVTDRGRGRERDVPITREGNGSRAGSAPISHYLKPPVCDQFGPQAPQYGSRSDRNYHNNDHPKPYAAPPKPLIGSYGQPHDRPYQPPPRQYLQPHRHDSVVSKPHPSPKPQIPPTPHKHGIRDETPHRHHGKPPKSGFSGENIHTICSVQPSRDRSDLSSLESNQSARGEKFRGRDRERDRARGVSRGRERGGSLAGMRERFSSQPNLVGAVSRDHESVDGGDSVDKKTTPAPVPTTLSVTVDTIFKMRHHLKLFLLTAVNDNQSPFELLPESVVTATSKTFCDLLAPSKAAAERIRKKLNSSTLENVVIKCHSSTAKQDKSSFTAEHIEEEMKKSLWETETMTHSSSKIYRDKIHPQTPQYDSRSDRSYHQLDHPKPYAAPPKPLIGSYGQPQDKSYQPPPLQYLQPHSHDSVVSKPHPSPKPQIPPTPHKHGIRDETPHRHHGKPPKSGFSGENIHTICSVQPSRDRSDLSSLESNQSARGEKFRGRDRERDRARGVSRGRERGGSLAGMRERFSSQPNLVGAVSRDHEIVDGGDSVNKKTTPAPIPTTLSVTVDTIFKMRHHLKMFLLTAVNDDQSPFELLPESVVTATSKTFCDLLAPSKAAAERIRKKLNSSTLENVVIICHETSSTAKQDKSRPSFTAEQIEEEIKKTLKEIEKKTNRSSEIHREKILQYEKALDILGSSHDKANDDYIDKVLAVRDRLKEAVKQEEEFHVYIRAVQKEIKGLNPMITSKGQLTEIQKRVGVECQRLVAGLPLYARRQDIIDKVSSNQVSVILGETGSGKSTQMAQYIFEAGLAGEGQIVCTQPRKMAAITLAERVAKEMAGIVGDLVGYKTGAREIISKSTKLVFCTDHSLLNECLEDRRLSNYTCIIVDEAHERSIYTDILLGMIKACLPQRPDLKVIITSATIDPSLFIKYFNTRRELRVSGRTFPVEVEYTDIDSSQEFENFEVRAVQKAVDVHLDEGVGDLLVFLTTPVEIMRCCEEFEKQMKDRNDYQCFPLHGQLPPDEQKKVFKRLPEGVRKVIFATNCAETSITIDGIKFVIDTGVAKEVRYDPKKNISLLGTHVISKSSADQRKGRAGRTCSGKCYRLYSEDGYNEMASGTVPEIMRVHLGQAVLKLAEIGVNIKTYDFVESPSTDAIDSALETLHELGAIYSRGITEIGRWISKLGIDPRQGYVIYQGSKNDLLYDAVVVAALISNGSNVFYRGLSSTEEQQSAKSKNEFGSPYGDIFTWLNVYKQWIQLPKEQQSKWCGAHSINYKVMSFTRQYVSDVAQVLQKELGMSLDYTFSTEKYAEHVLRQIIFYANISSLCHYLGHLRAGYFALDAQRQVHFHPSSSLVAQNAQPEWVVYTEFTKTSRDFIRGITAVDKDWVRKAVDQGRLEVDLEEVKQRRCDVVHKEEVGPSVFRRLVGPRFSHLRVLEDELTQAGMATVVVEADRELGTLDIYSSSPINKKCINKISEAKAEVIEKLKSDEDEMGIDGTKEGECGVRVALGQGGTVKAVLMPDQSNKILIKKSSRHTTKDDIIAKFGVFGDIRQCVKFKSADPWGFVRFASYLQAQEAVEKTKRDKDNVAVLKIDNRVRNGGSIFEARLAWCRKPIKGNGTAFIKCPPIEMAALIGKSIVASDHLCEIEVSKDGKDLICHNTGQTQEREIKRQVMKLLGYDKDPEMKINVTVLREKVDLSAERDREITVHIVEAFARYVPEEKFRLRWVEAKETTVYQVVFLQFNNPMEGFEACSRLNGRLHIGGQKAEISPNLKTTIHVPKAIMGVCKTRFDTIIEGLLEWDYTEVRKRGPFKSGDYAIDIISPEAKLIVEAREIFQRELEGEVIDCGDDSLYKCLQKKQGKEMLHKIGNVLEVLIVVDDRREKIHIYGSEKLVKEAKIRINKYLDKLEKGKQKDICFKDAGRPAGLMKALMKKYGNFPDDFIEKCGLSDVIIDFKHQRMSILGSDEAVQQAYASILELESTLRQPGKEQKEKLMPDCIICMCPIDNSSDVYRLEGCGHSYCSDCLKMQVNVSVKDKKFPITCAEESCGMPIMWRDFRLFLQKKWVSNNKLVSKSVEDFVTANQDKYRFCLTPNCPVAYEVTTSEDSNEYSCPSCAVSLCTSCHTPYHSGLNCRMARIAKRQRADELLFERWRMENKDKCKPCPGCNGAVEKIEGDCNKMHCTVCHTCFCWLCLEKFDDEQKCYAHLAKIHGGFYDNEVM